MLEDSSTGCTQPNWVDDFDGPLFSSLPCMHVQRRNQPHNITCSVSKVGLMRLQYTMLQSDEQLLEQQIALWVAVLVYSTGQRDCALLEQPVCMLDLVCGHAN
jgi:hypothetical protein